MNETNKKMAVKENRWMKVGNVWNKWNWDVDGKENERMNKDGMKENGRMNEDKDMNENEWR